MPTQKTNLSKGTKEETKLPGANLPSSPEESLGIPESPPYVPNPSGFEPASPPQMVAGRPLQPISPKELMAQHRAVAGDVSILGTKDGAKAPPKPQAPPRSMATAMPQTPAQRAELLLPDFLRPQQQASASQAEGATPPSPPPSTGGSGSSGGGSGDGPPPPDNVLLRNLIRESERAREEGDPALSARIRGLAEAALGGSRMNRKAPKAKGSSAMNRLRANLGLRKIKPAEVEWGGLKWKFAPSPAPLDYWMYSQLPDDPIGRGLHSAALGICASLVGLDDEPLWQVLSIPLTADYTIDLPDGGTDEISLNLHVKRCKSCSTEVEIQAESCKLCGASQDPFDVPLSLRFRYADMFFTWLQEEFGPYEELDELWTKMRGALKSRASDQEDLYPLLNWSQNQQTETPTSPSGAE